MRIFCFSERAINVLDGLRLVRGWWIDYGVRGNRPPFTRPFVESAIENANVLMAVVKKSPRNHPHHFLGGAEKDPGNPILIPRFPATRIHSPGSRHTWVA